MSISFTINGKTYKVLLTDHPVDITLNTFIREHAQLPGTKFMCLEGGCGVCICAIRGRHPVSKKVQTWATNSCLTLLNICDGWDIITVEGIGNKKDGYHPIQKRLAHLNGTQCGYCSPGMVMNMYGLMQQKDGHLTMEEIENSFGGNICRCTGYRPILDAMKSFASDADYDYVDICNDIEDIGKICPKTKTMCNGICKPNKIHVTYKDGAEWISAKSIKDIFEAFSKISNKKYMLVAGNTAHGVYRRSPDIEVFIDIKDVPEIHDHKIGETIELGGSMSLTETMDVLTKAAKNPGFEYCQEIVKHFDLIANVPVRNMGTLAGNLSIKHAHNEFPSDVFISLEAVNAQITLLEDENNTKTFSPADYLISDTKNKLLSKVTLQPKPQEKFLYKSYKIMPRAQNAHAFVNAGFLIEVNKDKVISARLCFGGIDPNLIHATETEAYLTGKNLFTNETIQGALKKLNSELKPDWVLPDASPEYRKMLASGLLYKFFLGTAGKDRVKRNYASGGDILQRPLSSGTQTYDTQKANYPLTEPIPKLEALVQCSGEAFYVNDYPNFPNQVWGALVHANQANAKIAEIDASEALKIPGIVAFYSAKDIPGKNNFVGTNFFTLDEVEEIFCSDKVKYFGQPLGMIVADTLNMAKYAAEKVKVLYEHTTEPVMSTLQDVFEHGAMHRITGPVKCKEVKKKRVSVKGNKKISGMLDMGNQYHFTMEPQTTVCIPKEDGLEVYMATQWMDLAQSAIAEALNIKAKDIYIQVRRLGGGYGFKISRGNIIACACALACKSLNRPVRFVQSLESMMMSLGKRFACHSDYEVEVDDNGKIIKLKNDYYEDAGCTLNENPEFLTQICAKNCYAYDGNWEINGKVVTTDAPSHTACRAPGTTEGIAMIENIMDQIASETNKDPFEVRMTNLAKDHKMKELIPQFEETIAYKSRRQEIDEYNKQNRWRKRGLGVGIMEFPSHYFGSINALVSIYHADGSVTINHGGIEMGQGINTKVGQVAAFVLGIPLDKITINASDTFTGANSIVSGGGVASETACYAVKKACEMILERLKPVKEKMKDAKWEDIIANAYQQNIILTQSSAFKVGDLVPYNIWGLCCTEVEVDILTGNILINRVDILEDTGESMSPIVDIGQIEGAFIMGIGYWLSEQLVFNRQSGELLTTRTWNYKPPGAKDIPIDFRINLLQKSKNATGFLRSKATGEPATCLSVTVIFALRKALESSREDAGVKEKWFHLGAPSTAENIMLSAGNTIEQFNIT